MQEQRAAKHTVEAFDNFATIRNGLRRAADLREHWAGIPLPIDGERLIIEPKYPGAEALMEMGRQRDDPDELDKAAKIRNRFWSDKKRGDVIIWEHEGKIDWGVVRGVNSLPYALSTLGCSVAWGIEQESNALQLLATMLKHHCMKQYLLTGMFLETSRRSGVTYLFRKLRPTVAITLKEARPRVLAALCMHPIGYYDGSWAGAMCPTDDVIAHLSLMRGDEVMFWRRCNQHAPWRAAAGL